MGGVLKLHHILNFFGKFADSQVDKGENLKKSGHVCNFLYDADHKYISGRVQASQKKQTYEVSMTLDGTSIKDEKCNCVRGMLCGHMAALLLYAHDTISCTDTSCRWIKPKESTEATTVTIDELYPRKKEYKPFESSSINPETWPKLLSYFKDSIRGGAGVKFLLEPEPEEDYVNIRSFQLIVDALAVVQSAEYEMASCKASFILTKLSVTSDQILAIEEITRGQASNPIWSMARRGRLTGSNLGKILTALRRGQCSKTLIAAIVHSKPLSAHAVLWGQNHEKVALAQFRKQFNLPVKLSGIWFHSCGFLAGSPDGLVGSNAIVEVKCPYSFRNDVLEEILNCDNIDVLHNQRSGQVKKDTYVLVFSNGECCINVEHDYYHQIQGNLYCTDRELCYLVIWTCKSLVCVKVPIDPEWEDNINRLQNFYVNEFIPLVRERRG